MKRLFIAIPLNDTIREQINKFSTALQQLNLDGNFVATENLHLTIKFLGNVEEKNIPSICEIIEKSLHHISQFSTKIKNIGAFPSVDNIQTIWIGVESSEMISLTHTIQNLLNHLRPEEHPHTIPHLTILCIKSEKNKAQFQSVLQKWQHTEFGTVVIDKVILYKSILTPTGPKYTILKEFKLK